MNTLKGKINKKEIDHIPFGPFKIRIPFIHYRFEWPDYFQGLLMCAVDLAAIPLIIELLGMPFEAAMAIVILNGILYLTHHLLGDPSVPGWITPAIPLIMIYVQDFDMGPDRVKALMAFQLMLGTLSIFLGVTKLAKKVVSLIPSSIKSGIIIGAGISAILTVFNDGGRFDVYPYSISISVGLAFYLIYSSHFSKLMKKNSFFKHIGDLGIFPIILIAVFISPILNESTWPELELSLIHI